MGNSTKQTCYPNNDFQRWGWAWGEEAKEEHTHTKNGDLHVKRSKRQLLLSMNFLRSGLKNKQLEITLGEKDAIYEIK